MIYPIPLTPTMLKLAEAYQYLALMGLRVKP